MPVRQHQARAGQESQAEREQQERRFHEQSDPMGQQQRQQQQPGELRRHRVLEPHQRGEQQELRCQAQEPQGFRRPGLESWEQGLRVLRCQAQELRWRAAELQEGALPAQREPQEQEQWLQDPEEWPSQEQYPLRGQQQQQLLQYQLQREQEATLEGLLRRQLEESQAPEDWRRVLPLQGWPRRHPLKCVRHGRRKRQMQCPLWG